MDIELARIDKVSKYTNLPYILDGSQVDGRNPWELPKTTS
jgi:hypothetical protein